MQRPCPQAIAHPTALKVLNAREKAEKLIVVIDGISLIDELSWEAFNEGSHMRAYIEHFRRRFGCYPKEVLADKIYCIRENRVWLKIKGIHL